MLQIVFLTRQQRHRHEAPAEQASGLPELTTRDAHHRPGTFRRVPAGEGTAPQTSLQIYCVERGKEKEGM